MKTKFIEATDASEFNWGKFAICRFDQEEWSRRSAMIDELQLHHRGWTPDNILFLDLQTGEGVILRPGGYVPADLAKHAIWICPMAQPFLEWLYRQDLTDLDALPAKVNLGKVPTALSGYRRPGVQAFLDDLAALCRHHQLKIVPKIQNKKLTWLIQALQGEQDPDLQRLAQAVLDKTLEC